MVFHESFTPLPDHTQLPCEDGTFVKNFQEHPQSILLTESIQLVLEQIHPDSQYCIGQDSGIYWRITDPPQRGAAAPDWFYVPNVPPALEGQLRRSYVLWQEIIPPLIVIEFVSGTGAEERDKTPWTGKFWVYETAIRPAYYAIYEVQKAQVEVYQLVSSRYQIMPANPAGRFPIEELGVELGIWQGRYQNVELPWLRWWDAEGHLLLYGREQAKQAKAEAEQERQKNERLRAKLRELGVDPDTL
ncbi:Uma2 family endonuclease [Spirulina major CS-329]|uniref:Uma2 family endonuclease n=1 Tax=Spirulina TaxID=1154 RepID=UPI00232BFBF8|nr:MULTISPECIES: Uma2 family endonuclease [Spirulina]MDB9495242.1 Uma2 family endonuclease [Spirulina subsalsa CS-330]MDB9503670.1 Uma2 family endonuclease [Spirulina major CS-329]